MFCTGNWHGFSVDFLFYYFCYIDNYIVTYNGIQILLLLSLFVNVIIGLRVKSNVCVCEWLESFPYEVCHSVYLELK